MSGLYTEHKSLLGTLNHDSFVKLLKTFHKLLHYIAIADNNVTQINIIKINDQQCNGSFFIMSDSLIWFCIYELINYWNDYMHVNTVLPPIKCRLLMLNTNAATSYFSLLGFYFSGQTRKSLHINLNWILPKTILLLVSVVFWIISIIGNNKNQKIKVLSPL